MTPEAATKPATAPILPEAVCDALAATPGSTAKALAAVLGCDEDAVLPALRTAESEYDVYSKGVGPHATWHLC